ncbi:MAG: hypothetical protein LBB63_00670 [Holosporaceae bacterium]|jgi:hypothetical protein|nr:hypothetical protein [Holosporaceae bacterium]
MNKVVVVLGAIVLITLGGLFFCAGLFTGSTMYSIQTAPPTTAKADDSGEKITMDKVEGAVDTKSATISEKIMQMLSSATDAATSTISDAVSSKKRPELDSSSQVTMNSLLREIAAAHAENDGCSPEKTMKQINDNKPLNLDSLQGKKVVFIGYFKNKIALQVQKLLTGKGYTVHVETSKAGDHESFVFCGPFKKDVNAKRLVDWLQKNNFQEARVVSVSDNVVEETIYDFVNDDSDLPKNIEHDTVTHSVSTSDDGESEDEDEEEETHSDASSATTSASVPQPSQTPPPETPQTPASTLPEAETAQPQATPQA